MSRVAVGSASRRQGGFRLGRPLCGIRPMVDYVILLIHGWKPMRFPVERLAYKC